MAWWDHEELKAKEYRSDRYKIEFSDEYTVDQVVEAFKRTLLIKRREKQLRRLEELNSKIVELEQERHKLLNGT